MTAFDRALALVRAGHPGPCLAITAITVLLAVAAGARDIGVLTIFGVAVLAGQFSIGWSNDYADAGRDAAAGRTDKPLVTGHLRPREALTAAFASVCVAFGLAVAIGPVTAAWLAPVVGGGWLYNAGLKSTWLSGLAYLVGFGPVPGLATSVLPGHPAPRPWALAAAGLLGLGAHFVNVLPDLEGDRTSGVRGLPQSVAGIGGERAVRSAALALLLGASALIALGSGLRTVTVVGFAATVLLGTIAARARGRTPFRCALAIAAVDVAMVGLSGGELT